LLQLLECLSHNKKSEGGGGGEGEGEILIPNCPHDIRTGVLSAKPPVNGISDLKNLSTFRKIKGTVSQKISRSEYCDR
jgi:hypothetical protein